MYVQLQIFILSVRMVVSVNVNLGMEALVAASVKLASGEHRWATVNVSHELLQSGE